jgi:hypothetical protein
VNPSGVEWIDELQEFLKEEEIEEGAVKKKKIKIKK